MIILNFHKSHMMNVLSNIKIYSVLYGNKKNLLNRLWKGKKIINMQLLLSYRFLSGGVERKTIDKYRHIKIMIQILKNL
jgi:hypothetical protein